MTQSEQILEDNLVAQLTTQGYEQVAVTDEASLLANLKAQIEKFNDITLTDAEFAKVNHLTRSEKSVELRVVSVECQQEAQLPTPNSTLNTQHSTLNTQHSTLTNHLTNHLTNNLLILRQTLRSPAILIECSG